MYSGFGYSFLILFLCFLGTRIGAMARPFLKRRESIARKNLELCFRSILSGRTREDDCRSPVHSAWRW
ncbi:hypothetical protein ACLBOM_13085 [Escherichia coli]